LYGRHIYTKTRQKKTGNTLFTGERKQFIIPILQKDVFGKTFEQLELLEFSLYNSFELLNESLPNHPKSTDLADFIGK